MLDKIIETNKEIEKRRATFTSPLSNLKAVENWEKENIQKGTPLKEFYSNWRKLRDKELLRRNFKIDEVNEADIPTVKRKQLSNSKPVDKEEFPALFGNDDSDDNGGGSVKSEEDDKDDLIRFLPKEERRNMKLKRKPNEAASGSGQNISAVDTTKTSNRSSKKKKAAGNEWETIVVANDQRGDKEDVVKDLKLGDF